MSTPTGGQVAVRIVIDRDGITSGMNTANRQIVAAAEDTGKKAGDRLSDGIKKGAAAAGAAAGAALAVAAVDAIGREAETDRVAAALGLTSEEAGRAAEVAAEVYKNAWGASTAEAAAGVKAVMEQIGGMRTASSADLQATTEHAMALATTFQVDVAQAAASVGTMMKTGMAADAQQAFDIITAGFQAGVDKRGDYLDTLTEYSTLFRNLGIDGATATGMLAQGLANGARDADKVGDALKELSIRAVDGSNTTREAYANLGMDADTMAARFAAGGASASGALADVLDGLRGMEDPVAQTATAVGLFGTQAEDLGAALYSLDPTTAVQSLGQVEGAAAQMATTVGDNTATKIEAAKRSIQDLGLSVVEHTGPLGAFAAALGSFAPAAMGVLGPLAMMTSAWGATTGAIVKNTAAWVANAAAQVASKVASLAMVGVSLVVRAATAAWTAVQWLLNAAFLANPITWIVLAVVALVAAIVLAYKNSETFRNIVQKVGQIAAAAFGWIVDAVKKVGEWIGKVFGWVRDNWSKIGLILTGPIGWAVKWITGNWDKVMGFFKAIPGKLGELFKGVVNAITFPFRTAFNAISKLWNSTIGKLAWTIPDWVPGVGGKTIAAPKLPELQGLATGGTVTRAGAFLVGEAGPEVVTLPAGAAVTPNGGGGPGGHITININGGNLAEVRRVVEDAISGNNRRLASAYRASMVAV